MCSDTEVASGGKERREHQQYFISRIWPAGVHQQEFISRSSPAGVQFIREDEHSKTIESSQLSRACTLIHNLLAGITCASIYVLLH